uniref:Prenyltransferase alpha-alpha toroid domain-containing protein n=1 Tax=Glossina pallidipes TaxID=7398 RepID=A0A1B0AHK3_GLOPL
MLGITVEDVKKKWQSTRKALKRLDNSDGNDYTSLRTYMWWARKLGLTKAVDKMTRKMARKRPSAYVVIPVEVEAEALRSDVSVEVEAEMLRSEDMEIDIDTDFPYIVVPQNKCIGKIAGNVDAVSVAKLRNMLEQPLKRLFDKTGDWIATCQTYEGDFSGTPDFEVHGGYTFCRIAALALLNEDSEFQTVIPQKKMRFGNCPGLFEARGGLSVKI